MAKLNWYYVAVIVLGVVTPIASFLYSTDRPSGSRPHGLFFLGLLIAGLMLLIVGAICANTRSRKNARLLAAAILVFALSLGVLFLMNFAANFSV